MHPRVLFATAWLVAFPAVASFAADDTSSERAQEKTTVAPSPEAEAPAAGDTRAAADNLQTARKPDESPFSEIKILPSF
jgi:hypothetical protein